MDRRAFLQLSGTGLAMTASGVFLSSCILSPLPPLDPSLLAFVGYGALQAADGNGLELPPGFTSRVIATTGQQVAATGYVWHPNPDGGACFAVAGGGWIYVSNNEGNTGTGGVSMVEFDASGAIVDARSILSGTTRNCAGGPTPWGTWLSCEETSTGQVWECDPTGATPAVARPLMGRFSHEAAAIDPLRQYVYLTEDVSDGALYRFVPTTWGDLSAGVLEVLTESSGVRSWQTVPDPDGSPVATRNQVANTKRFNGGEGICLYYGLVYFTTKGDNRVWAMNADATELSVIYDDNAATPANLTGVDNIESSARGLLVAEDGGNMQIVLVDRFGTGANEVFLELTGVSGSEITGPAFSPDGSRFYFSSQRSPGRTYEVTGPF